jgi:hypothetical protein
MAELSPKNVKKYKKAESFIASINRRYHQKRKKEKIIILKTSVKPIGVSSK